MVFNSVSFMSIGDVSSAPISLARANSDKLRAPWPEEAVRSDWYSSSVSRKIKILFRGLVIAMEKAVAAPPANRRFGTFTSAGCAGHHDGPDEGRDAAAGRSSRLPGARLVPIFVEGKAMVRSPRLAESIGSFTALIMSRST